MYIPPNFQMGLEAARNAFMVFVAISAFFMALEAITWRRFVLVVVTVWGSCVQASMEGVRVLRVADVHHRWPVPVDR